MNADQFLARVVAPGAYLVIAHKKPAEPGMFQRFFPRDDIGGAAGYLKWATASGADAYFALASFNAAHQDGVDKIGRPRLRGERTHENADALRCFWIDCDVQRPGEKKTDCYPTRRDAATWLCQFLNATGLPGPNLRVDSGYGFHWYWVLEDPMPRAAWQPYANALKEALLETGFKSIAGLSNDAARILRPPETDNMKGGTRIPVRVMAGSRGDYPNDIVLTKLQRWVGIAPSVTKTAAQTQVAGLAGAGPSAAFAGTPQPNMAAAAQANITKQERSFAIVATKCKQVEMSLAAGGNGDPYQLWYLGFLSLAHHCSDGDKFVHEISKGDPRYDAGQTDIAVARIDAEKAKKDRGPPRCKSFDGWRSGVCQGCPFNGKITSPWVLGTDAPDVDLPRKYRRHEGALQHWVERADGSQLWVNILEGDVFTPMLDWTPVGWQLSFTYERAGKRYPIRVMEREFRLELHSIRSTFAEQFMSLDRREAPMFGDFVVAWIKLLQAQNAQRPEIVKPFGYAVDTHGDHAGVAVGGTLYCSDGSQELAPGADPRLVAGFTPAGKPEKWREAFDLVCAGRPDLQVIVGAAFGSPLMHFTGHKGLVISAWSQASGVGKSSAMRVGQAVWSSPKFLTSLDDTTNSVNDKIASTQFMPCYWDEMRIGKEHIAALVHTIFAIAQGKEKGRLGANLQQREVREWEALVIVAGNVPLMDHVVSQVGSTDAGAVRLFEYNITVPSLTNTAQAARVIQQVNYNYGHVGRTFIAYVATHFDAVSKLVHNLSDTLQKDLGAIGEERMYVAGIACILAGAKIATQIGVAAFDLKELYAILKATFFLLRADRGIDLITSNGQANAEQILSMFVSDFAGSRLITSRFHTPGPHAMKVDVLWAPPVQGKVEIHVGVSKAIMRINRDTFAWWCRRKGLNALDTMKQVEQQLCAKRTQSVIGGGTGFAGGRIYCLEIPLTDPKMASYMSIPTSTSQAAALAAPPTPGNQAKA